MRPLAALQEAVRLAPESAQARCDLGLALGRRGEDEEALTSLRAAVDLAPDCPAYHRALGHVLMDGVGAFEEAADCFSRAFALDPESWKSCAPLGWLYSTVLNRPAEARRLCKRVIAQQPERDATYVHFCRAYLDEQPADRTFARLERALPRQGDMARLKSGFSTALTRVGRYHEARQFLRRRLHEAEEPHVLTLLAGVEAGLGNLDTATALLARAWQLAPDSPLVWTWSVTHAWRVGDVDRVKHLMQVGTSGRQASERGPLRPATETSLAGATILLKEMPNGYGDTIQWGRVARAMRACGARVVLEGRTPLRRLLQQLPGAERVVVPHDDYPAVAHQFYPFSLPPGIDWAWEHLGDVPYLRAPADMVRTWTERIGRRERAIDVGIEWGAKGLSDLLEMRDPYTQRTLPFERLAPLLSIPGVRCHSLHRGMRTASPDEPRVRMTDLGKHIRDFMDTAAAISALDAVVTVDTAIAHVAGALGKPTLVMLPYYGEWRWGPAGGAVPWYPTARAYRQRTPGDWQPVVADVAAALREMAKVRARRNGHSPRTSPHTEGV